MSGNTRQASKKNDHLLIIRFSAMGDVAMLVPVLRLLVARFPDLKVTVLTRGFFAPIFKDMLGVSVYAADLKGRHKGISGLFLLSRELKNLGITAIADMHNVLRSNVMKIFFLNSGVVIRQIDKGRSEKKALTANKNKEFKQLKTTHQRYADVLAELGFKLDLRNPVYPKKHVLPAKLMEVTGPKDLIWIGIAPFAAHKAKAYPMGLLEEVLKQLGAIGQMKIFLFGGGQDENKQLEVIAADYNHVISLAGKLQFSEELHVISNLDLMVSMDSSNAHLAAMYGIRVLTIWGVTHPFAGFGAFDQPEDHHLMPNRRIFPAIPTSIYGNKFPAGYEKAIETITPAVIVEKINSMLLRA